MDCKEWWSWLIGFLGLFRDAGLGMATIQRHEVTHEQTSTLFWINVAIGTILTTLCAALAPLVSKFYHQPRLYWVVVVSGLVFLFNGLAAQHSALLQRAMRFVTQAKIDVLSLAVSSAVGVVMGILGCRYWSLVAMAVTCALVTMVLLWLAVQWLPGPPRRRCGLRSMLHFGGLATCNGFVVFLAWNAEKLLLGRFCGADALGLYGRAFQLVTLPVQQLNTAVTGVAFPALSRIQQDASRLARSFLKAYPVLISLTVTSNHHFCLISRRDSSPCAGCKMDGSGTDFQAAGPRGAGIRSGQPALLVGHVYGSDGTRLGNLNGHNPARNHWDRAGFEIRPGRRCPGIFNGHDALDHPDRGLVQGRDKNHLDGSLGSYQTAVRIGCARRHDRIAAKAHAR